MNNKIITNGIEIDIRNEKCLYITIGGYTYYIDDTTNEQIIESWDKNWEQKLLKK